MTYSLAIHGGAGVMPKAVMTAEKDAAFRHSLNLVIKAGEDVLRANGTALDAVTAAVYTLEDDPLFNAGRGAVFNVQGKQEMDAAIMEGEKHQAGAVAGIFGPKNPIGVARLVMEQTDHVFIIGSNALKLAKDAGLPFEESEYFFTQERWQSLQKTLKMRKAGVTDDDPARKHGTVGAVARDVFGNLAAATSTGGMTAKEAGRVGDTPCIGAGTYADNETCAVSATGYGEIFLRITAASEIAARMRYAGESLESSASHVVMHDLVKYGGTGGIIAIDYKGNIAMPFNCDGMYRGSVRQDQQAIVEIY